MIKESGAKQMGERILRLRLKKGMSQHDVARRSGVTQPSIAAIEKGKRESPRPATVLKIAEALDCTVDYLYGWD